MTELRSFTIVGIHFVLIYCTQIKLVVLKYMNLGSKLSVLKSTSGSNPSTINSKILASTNFAQEDNNTFLYHPKQDGAFKKSYFNQGGKSQYIIDRTDSRVSKIEDETDIRNASKMGKALFYSTSYLVKKIITIEFNN